LTPYKPLAVRLDLGRSFILGQTFDEMLGFSPLLGDFLRLGGHGLGSFVGIWVGVKEKGFVSALGWIIGLGQGVAGVCDLVSIIMRAADVHPPEKTDVQAPAPGVLGMRRVVA
jgi:hypothetical protein